jgi:FkbM family methyltransferase
MKLHQPSFANRLAKRMAKPLSRVVCSRLVYKPSRVLDAYLNFLVGKGAGTGWDMAEEVRAATTRIRRARPVVFDVGANVGNWSQSLLHSLPDARVYMFDPSPGCQAAIREKALPGVKLLPCALGETAEQKTYYSSSATDGTASLHVRRDTPFQELTYQTSTVTVRTLDDVIESEQIDFVDFMKMDIEGHELFALRGARRSLAAGKIGALSFEFGCGNVNSRTFFRDFWDLLTSAGFALYRITPCGKDIQVESYYEDAEYFRGVTNFVAELKGAQVRGSATASR